MCKHNIKWQHVSQWKASVFCSSQKTMNINKTHQLVPGIGAAILEVIEPHLNEDQCHEFAPIFL